MFISLLYRSKLLSNDCIIFLRLSILSFVYLIFIISFILSIKLSFFLIVLCLCVLHVISFSQAAIKLLMLNESGSLSFTSS